MIWLLMLNFLLLVLLDIHLLIQREKVIELLGIEIEEKWTRKVLKIKNKFLKKNKRSFDFLMNP